MFVPSEQYYNKKGQPTNSVRWLSVFITSICSSLAVGLEEIESQISNQEYQKTEIDKQLASLKNQIEEQKKLDSAITSEMAAVLKQKQQEKNLGEIL